MRVCVYFGKNFQGFASRVPLALQSNRILRQYLVCVSVVIVFFATRLFAFVLATFHLQLWLVV